MSKLLIENVSLIDPGRKITGGALAAEGGKIKHVGSIPRDFIADQRIDGRGKRLTPGLIDVHTHGIQHSLYERGPEEIAMAAAMLPQFGTTCILPTLYRVMDRPSLPMLERLTEATVAAKGICFPGFHLEGPFLALPGAGADTVPGDMGLLAELFAACKGHITAMSISPDTPNIIPVIEWLTEKGIVSFMTHTRASADQTQAAIDAGSTHATHFYDVFPFPPEYEPGVRPVGAVEAILANRHVSVDFIADGCHVDPWAIRCALAAKGYEGIILITDSNIGAGLPPGEYDTSWGYRVKVRPGDGARHATKNFLAGSALTMNVGMANLLKWLNLLPEQIWAMGTRNVARMLGLPNKGTLGIGADADLVLWNDDLTPARTWVGGELVFNAES